MVERWGACAKYGTRSHGKCESSMPDPIAEARYLQIIQLQGRQKKLSSQRRTSQLPGRQMSGLKFIFFLETKKNPNLDAFSFHKSLK